MSQFLVATEKFSFCFLSQPSCAVQVYLPRVTSDVQGRACSFSGTDGSIQNLTELGQLCRGGGNEKQMQSLCPIPGILHFGLE